MKGNIEKEKVFVKLEPVKIIDAKKSFLETKKEIVEVLMTINKFKEEITDESRKIGMLRKEAGSVFRSVENTISKLPKREDQEKQVRLVGKRKLRERSATKMDLLENELEEIKRKLEKF